MKDSKAINGGLCDLIPISLKPNGVVKRLFPNPRIFLTRHFLILFLLTALPTACERPGSVHEEKGRTLTADERYIVMLYMKITEIEENLQDNPEERDKKWNDIRREFDPERVQRILKELEKNPKRWLAIYGRINELSKRRNADRAT